MNRRRFFGLVGAAVAAAVVPWNFTPRVKQVVAPLLFRGTYCGWDRPGCP